jgi:predicted MFS family arabinose efflux permease
MANILPSWLLIVIVGIASLTTPLSGPGLRSLFPVIVPAHLWERMNAIDSSGFVIATIIGPPLAAVLVALVGGPLTIMAVGFCFGIAAIVIARTPEPAMPSADNGKLFRDAWKGLVYTWRNPTLRGLGFSLSVLNLGGGAMNIVIPLIVLDRLHLHETAVGLAFALQGVTGMVSAVLSGRRDSRNRERFMLAAPMLGLGVVTTALLFKVDLLTLALVMGMTGILNGPLDIALFTLRQRRTDPAWTGRAFTVSMSFNSLGVPVGSAAAGVVASYSIEAALAFTIVTCVISGILALTLIPARG